MECGVWSVEFGGSRKRFQEVSGGGLRKSWVEDNRSLSVVEGPGWKRLKG